MLQDAKIPCCHVDQQGIRVCFCVSVHANEYPILDPHRKHGDVGIEDQASHRHVPLLEATWRADEREQPPNCTCSPKYWVLYRWIYPRINPCRRASNEHRGGADIEDERLTGAHTAEQHGDDERDKRQRLAKLPRPVRSSDYNLHDCGHC